jgi:hypothetical protein
LWKAVWTGHSTKTSGRGARKKLDEKGEAILELDALWSYVGNKGENFNQRRVA